MKGIAARSALVVYVALFISILAIAPHAQGAEITVKAGIYDSPPLCSTTDNPREPDLLTSILSFTAKKERWHVVYVSGSLPDLLDKLDRGEIDLLVGAPYTKEYTEKCSFSRESVVSTWAQIYSAAPAKLETPLDLQSLNVGIMRDDLYNGTMREMAKSYNIGCTFMEFNDYGEIFTALDKGWIDAGVIDRLNASLHEGVHRAVRTNVFFAPIEIRFAVKKYQNENLINALDYHLGILKGKPESLYYTILNRITRARDDSRLLQKMKWGLGVAGIFLLLLVGVSLILRRQVNRKTSELLRKNLELEQEISIRQKAEDELLRQKDYLTALHETAVGLLGRLNLDNLLEGLIENASMLIGTPHGFIFLYDVERNDLEMKVGSGVYADRGGSRIALGSGLPGKVFETGEPRVVYEAAGTTGEAGGFHPPGIASSMCIPVITSENTLGVMGLSRSESSRPFTGDEIEILSRFAELASIAISNARLYTRLEEELKLRMLVENALQKSEERYRSVFENTGTATIIVDEDGTISMVNAQTEELSGYTCWDIEGRMKTKDFIHQDDRGRVAAMHRTWERTGRKPEEYEIRLVGRHMNLKDIIVRECTIPETSQRVVSLIDITERKRGEQERLRLATAIEQSTESVIITDTERVVRYVNPVFEEITGYCSGEIIGKTTDVLLGGNAPSQATEPSKLPVALDRSWKGRITCMKKDGTRYRTETRIAPIRDTAGTVINYVITQRDVSNEELLESQLRQSQKMEAIGTLAGGIAHDFNNILSPIIGFSELALSDISPDSPATRKIQRILQSAERARDLVNQILTFSRQREQEVKPVDMRSIVKETLKLIRATIPATIDIVPSIPQHGSVVMGDVTQIHQVLLNLCTNASYAMQDGGGVLDVRLDNVDIDAQSANRYLNMEPGPYVCLTVSDTGSGMDKATMERIFEPFFTTKNQQGTGLGLAMVHGIVKGMNGWINVYSEPGRGTTFKIYLPRVDREAEMRTAQEDSLSGGSETILYVDDEEFITEMAKEMLESLGYRVEPRTSSIEALKAFIARPDRFDLIITDQTMPNMTGLELIAEVRSIRSDIPVILCTGFSESVTQEKARGSGVREIIFKPFIKREFSQAVRKAIDGSQAGGAVGNGIIHQ